jgi:hypothetical protein
MESKDIINPLAVNLFTNKDLIIRVVQFLATHDAHAFQVFAILNELTKAYRGDIGTSKVQVLNELEVLRYLLYAFVFDLGAAKEVQLPEVLKLFELANTLIRQVAALGKRQDLEASQPTSGQVSERNLVLMNVFENILRLLTHEEVDVIVGEETVLQSLLTLWQLLDRFLNSWGPHLLLNEFGQLCRATEGCLAVDSTGKLRVIDSMIRCLIVD